MPGFSSKRRSTRSLVALLGLASTAPSVALAQLAPTGEHYAARESDTGFAGEVNSNGGYGASVPLDLPSARGGLKVPLQVVYGGRQFGTAGLGWDVPLSSVRRDVTVARRRPANNPDASPQPREQLSLTLDGKGIDLVRNAEDTAWSPAAMTRRADRHHIRLRRRLDAILPDGRAAARRLDEGASQPAIDRFEHPICDVPEHGSTIGIPIATRGTSMRSAGGSPSPAHQRRTRSGQMGCVSYRRHR
jgi:hypothetical protein